MLFDGIWYTPESQLCHTPKEKRPETPRESGRYIWGLADTDIEIYLYD